VACVGEGGGGGGGGGLGKLWRGWGGEESSFFFSKTRPRLRLTNFKVQEEKHVLKGASLQNSGLKAREQPLTVERELEQFPLHDGLQKGGVFCEKVLPHGVPPLSPAKATRWSSKGPER